MAKLKVMATGTFDLLHPGHIDFLKRAKREGDYFIVVIARDETVEQEKGKTPSWDQEKRKAEIEHLGIADKVVIGNPGDKLKIVEEEKPDIICLGYDQEYDEDKMKKVLAKRGVTVEIKRMKAYLPEKYKTTLLRKD